MTYAELKIIRPLYTHLKKISSLSLKIGDRFIYPPHKCLMFKTDLPPMNGKFLCCDDSGKTKWIDEKEKVGRINGVAVELMSISMKFITEYKRQANERRIKTE